jgi:hypothetical protein
MEILAELEVPYTVVLKLQVYLDPVDNVFSFIISEHYYITKLEEAKLSPLLFWHVHEQLTC